ncbi:MAG: hypothetical protein MI739_01040 [Bacteroidales bacterium]|nr:hypothetical protein [Bacteroidales bacterium]
MDKQKITYRLNVLALIAWGLGTLSYTFFLFFESKISEFLLGFFEGFSLSIMCLWGIYMVYSFIKKQNPFRPRVQG